MFEKWGTFFDDHWPQFFARVFASLTAILAFFISDEAMGVVASVLGFEGEPRDSLTWYYTVLLVVMAFSGFATIVFWICESRRRTKISDVSTDNTILKERIEGLKESIQLFRENTDVVFKGHLCCFAIRVLDFQADRWAHSSDRITLYIVDDARRHFVPVGRYSSSPRYGEPGRTQYPLSQGCIGKAWDTGWCFDNRIPKPPDALDAASIKDSEFAEYMLENYRIPKTTVSKLTMKSTLIAGYRIDVDEGRESLGIIVVESTDGGRFEEDELKTHLVSQSGYLSHMIRVLKPYIPTAECASHSGGKGF